MVARATIRNRHTAPLVDPGVTILGRRFAGPALVFAVLVGVGVIVLFLTNSGPPRPESVLGIGTLADPAETYDPVKAGEEKPRGFRQLLARDRIAPIYDPMFVSAAESEWRDDALVIGVEIDGDARAYPVRHLNSREMVIDRIAGIPVLVTW